MPELRDVVEIRADSIEEASIEDIFILGKPFGRILDKTEYRAKNIDNKQLGDRPEHFDEAATLWSLVEQQQAEIEQLKQQLQEEAVRSGMSEQQRERVDRIEELVEYAFEEGRGGSKGVSLESPLVSAVTGVSRSKATEYIGDVAAVFEWANKKDANGPNPMELRIDTDEHDLDDVLDDVRRHYQDR